MQNPNPGTGPADAARRALRAARDRGRPSTPSTEEAASHRDAGPGDAAREALRGGATPAGTDGTAVPVPSAGGATDPVPGAGCEMGPVPDADHATDPVPGTEAADESRLPGGSGASDEPLAPGGPRAPRQGDAVRTPLGGLAGSAPGTEAVDGPQQSDVSRELGESWASRPGDAAREALRGPSGSAPGSETADEPDMPRLGDVARASLRGLAGSAPGIEAVDEPRQSDAPRAARPGDVARAALRGVAGSAPGIEAADEPPQSDEPRPPRPGDAARAALRRRMASADGGVADAVPSGEVLDASQGAGGTRPGDAARAALRRPAGSVSADGHSAEPGASTGRPVDPVADGTPAAGERRPAESGGVRPGDLAREALRAARAEARRGEASGSRAARTPAERAVDAVARAGAGDVSRDRARAVRQVLAGAFRMPSDASGPEPQPEPDVESGVAAHVPRSMAAPARDGDHRRTFPALAPRPAASRFAETWWGNAWVAALEEGALDAKRLARGRSYAEQGSVDAITVTPGLVLAYVRGSRPRPYRVQVRLRTFGADDWERFLDAAVERPAHIAALLDKEMPESLAECGVPLLPGPGDLDPHCTCPDRGHPCKHAAALCYQTARLLDADPFVLLLLRGRGERELLDALSRRNATRAARAAQERDPAPLPGVRATEALAARRLPPLPPPSATPAHPEQPPAYPSAPGGPDAFQLDQLATDAAARAHALLATGHDEIGQLTLWQDAVRLAAARPGTGLTAATRSLYASLASAAGRTPADLARAVAAWRQGGPDGLTVLEEPWDPPAGRFDRARPLLLAADLPAFRPWRNHLTHPRGGLQLRFGRDGLWYAYESEPGRDDWWPRGTPDPDPVGALTGLGGDDPEEP